VARLYPPPPFQKGKRQRIGGCGVSGSEDCGGRTPGAGDVIAAPDLVIAGLTRNRDDTRNRLYEPGFVAEVRRRP